MANKESFLKPVRGGDDGKQAQKFYREYFPSLTNHDERGETWFTPIALLEKLGGEKKIMGLYQGVENAFTRGRGGVKRFKLKVVVEISKIMGQGNTINLSDDYWSLANFGYHPGDLNRWRGAYNRSRMGDFPDLFFESVRDWFLEEDPVPNGVGYSVIERDKLDEFGFWFGKFGNRDESGWRNYVEQMQLKGNFVKDDFTVQELYCGHTIGNPFPDLSVVFEEENRENVRTIEGLAEILISLAPIRKCIETIYEIWDKRAQALSAYCSHNR